jgi:uncharacterized membrane protein YgdD (TMEM256/DUF423 family)
MMNSPSRAFLGLGALFGAGAVAVGAIAAHTPAAAAQAGILQTAVQYQFIHALALMMVGVLLRDTVRGVARGGLLLAGALFSGGLLLFSLNLQARALLDLQQLHAAVPLGGGAYLLGWLVLAASAVGLRSAR